ncbi:MAG: sporulation initiation factor Spo0A C-terminal domain-containing protein [Christensenellaceae bacterium]
MSRFHRTLIVEQSREYVLQIKEMLSGISESFESTIDGNEALELYNHYKPDLILVEAIMPGYDGFALMERILEDDIVKIVLTSMNQEIIIKKAFELKANYLFVKPYIKEIFVARILEVADFKDSRSKVSMDSNNQQFLLNQISVSLKRLGIPVSIKGYKMVRDALMILCGDFSKIDSINDNVYLQIAKKYNTTSQCVERNIRHAIETAATRGDPEAFIDYFGYSISSDKGKPTNREFIAALADKIIIQDK